MSLFAAKAMSPTVEGMVGSSRAISKLRAYLPKLAVSNANVLITGQTGVGKERVAQAIHHSGPRRDKPFISVNCGAIPDTLLESELFGHERGAYTGADGVSPGKIRMAEGGSVFLDEIGEMSAHGQATLLRVLENREIYPLGGCKMIRTDARFIAATNQDLERLVVAGKFRQDLFFRLNVARIHLPPLTERKEDIADLLLFFLNQYRETTGHCVEGFTPELMKCFLYYDWPGNVREIRNLVEAIFIDPPRGLVSFENLPDTFARIFQKNPDDTSNERDRIFSALCKANWNKTKAADLLKMSRMTLYRKMSKLNVKYKDRSAA